MRAVPFLSPARWLAAAAAFALLATPAGAQSAPGIDNIDMRRQDVSYTEDALRAFNEMIARLGEAWRSGDPKRVAELYSLGTAVGLGEEGLIRSREALQRGLEGRIPEGSDLRFATADFVSWGDLMSGTGTYLLERQGGDPVVGSFSMTIRRELGRWKIRSLVLSPGIPPAPPREAGD